MAPLSLSQGTLTGGSHGFLHTLQSKLIVFLDIVGASIRVSRAVESRTAAHPDDLATLGIKGPLPRQF